MANRQLYPVSFSANPRKVDFDLSIPTNGATTPVASGIRGRGAVVTRTGVGVMTVVLSAGHDYLDLLSSYADLRLAAIANTWAQVGTWVPATRTLTINCLNGSGVATEWPAADPNNILHVSLCFGSSNTKPANV
jgi:hypothetical protein